MPTYSLHRPIVKHTLNQMASDVTLITISPRLVPSEPWLTEELEQGL